MSIKYMICNFRLLQEQNMELLARLEMVITGYDQHMKDVAVFAMVSND